MFKSVATLDFYEFQCRCWSATLLQPLARKIPDWPTLRATDPEAAADMSEQNIDHRDKFWPLEPGHNRRCCQRRPMHLLKAVQCHFILATDICVYGQSCFWIKCCPSRIQTCTILQLTGFQPMTLGMTTIVLQDMHGLKSNGGCYEAISPVDMGSNLGKCSVAQVAAPWEMRIILIGQLGKRREVLFAWKHSRATFEAKMWFSLRFKAPT